MSYRIPNLGRRMRRMVQVASAVALAACSGLIDEPRVGSESHFLRTCVSDCGAGLECIQSVCTRSCLVNKDSCSDLAQNASCTDQSIEPGAVAVCDLACSRDDDCARLGTGYRCSAGFCRGTPIGTSTGTGGANAGGAGAMGGTSSVPPAGSCRVAYRNYVSGSTAIVPPPIGCGACNCNDGVVSCTGVDPSCPAPIEPCADDAPVTDPIDAQVGWIAGDVLTLELDYGGGCATHDFRLCYGPAFLESYPVQVSLRLIHDSHGDSCEAMLHSTAKFNLLALANAYNAAYLTQGGLVSTSYGQYVFGDATCDERQGAADSQIASLVQATATQCSTDADCQGVSLNTRCAAACLAVASTSNAFGKLGATNLTAAISSIDQATCSGWVDKGCTPSGNSCPTVNLQVRCIAGTCQ